MSDTMSHAFARRLARGGAAFGLALGVALAAGLAPAPAAAQLFERPPAPVMPPPPGDDPGAWTPDGAPAPQAARRCLKMCAADESPCDPISYKLADGRCEGIDDGGW